MADGTHHNKGKRFTENQRGANRHRTELASKALEFPPAELQVCALF